MRINGVCVSSHRFFDIYQKYIIFAANIEIKPKSLNNGINQDNRRVDLGR